MALIDSMDAPLMKNEIIPMGSTFIETEPNSGVTIMESGKVKYGS